MKAAQLQFSTRGIKGGNPTPYKATGSVSIMVDTGYTDWNNDCIYIDCFQGQGQTYERREQSEITITKGNKEWKGTFDQLVNLLITEGGNEI